MRLLQLTLALNQNRRGDLGRQRGRRGGFRFITAIAKDLRGQFRQLGVPDVTRRGDYQIAGRVGRRVKAGSDGPIK